jgi:hypothetical protein
VSAPAPPVEQGESRSVIGRLVDLARWPLALLRDVRAIADSTRVLPDVLERLGAIERHVGSLDDEVTRMRQGVESVGGDVVELRQSVEPIQRTAETLGRFTRRRARADRAE